MDIDTDIQRRLFLQTALVAAGGLMSATSAQAAGATEGSSAGTRLIHLMHARIPEGKLSEWSKFWGTQVLPVYAKGGQLLWGGWSDLSGQQSTITHAWAYRDLAHFDTQSREKETDPDTVAVMKRQTVDIDGYPASTVMTSLPYHPTAVPEVPEDRAGIIVTHRIDTNSDDPKVHNLYIQTRQPGPREAYASATKEYVQLASKHGAQLAGAFKTYRNLQPAYNLIVWRYPSFERYWAVRNAIEADPECQRLLIQMRSIYPREVVNLARPLSYSPLR